MAEVIGQVTGPADQKKAMFVEALQKALENAPPPPPGTDIQNFRLLAVELEHGGFVGVDHDAGYTRRSAWSPEKSLRLVRTDRRARSEQPRTPAATTSTRHMDSSRSSAVITNLAWIVEGRPSPSVLAW